jgi:hypothetical protein
MDAGQIIPHIRLVPKKPDDMLDLFRENLSRELDARKVDNKTASLEAGLGDSFVSDVLKRRNPKLDGVARLARTHNLSIDQLLGLPMRQQQVAPKKPIQVVGEVTGGQWREVNTEDFQREESPFPADPAFPTEAQYDLIVRGNSINLFARDGERLRCVDIHKAGLEIYDGDLVIFERIRDGGQLVLTTAKRVRRRGPILELWPESDDPHWKEPIRIDLRQAKSGETGRVIALVLYSYRPARRGLK